MNNKLIWVLVAVLIVGLGGFFLLNSKTNTPVTKTTTQSQDLTPTQTANNSAGSEVSVTSSGFEPQTIKIKAGAKVVWVNKSGAAVTVNSNPHPVHTLWPFLNLGSFDDGSSVSVVFEKAGTYTYHNHFNTAQKGTVVVE